MKLCNSETFLCVCVVMSFPAEGVESAIKNNIEDVRLFLDSRHAGHYAVYNLSKRSYRPSRFHNRVWDVCNSVCVCVCATFDRCMSVTVGLYSSLLNQCSVFENIVHLLSHGVSKFFSLLCNVICTYCINTTLFCYC